MEEPGPAWAHLAALGHSESQESRYCGPLQAFGNPKAW